MNKLFDIILKIGIITILIIAIITKQQYAYYIFVRWAIFCSSIYLAYKTRNHKGIFGIRFGVIFFSAVTILFNPFIPFNFQKSVWRIIDLIVIADLIIFFNWKEYVESLSVKGKLISNLIKKSFWGVLAIIFAVWFVRYSINVNPYDEYLLISKGVTTNGFITNAEEYEETIDIPESQGGGSEEMTRINYTYQFTTKDGKTIKDRSSELGGIEDFKGDKIPIQVEYLSDNPNINRVKNASNQCETLSEFLWRRIGLGLLALLLCCSVGFYLIREAIKDYLIEIKKLTNNINLD